MALKDDPEYLDYYVANLWESHAKAWCRINDGGYNVGRDQFLTPEFLSILPDVKGAVGLDAGCGDGYNTNAVSKLGTKKIYGLDLSRTMVAHAHQYEDRDCAKLEFQVGDILNAPFDDGYFDFVTAFFTLIYIPNYEKALSEIYRVLKPGGFFQFSITHPCFWTHKIQWTNNRKGVIAKNYAPNSQPIFGAWGFENVPREENAEFTTYLFRRTFSEWINGLVDVNFRIDKLEELVFPKKLVVKHKSLKGFDKIPFFVVFRASKPMSG